MTGYSPCCSLLFSFDDGNHSKLYYCFFFHLLVGIGKFIIYLPFYNWFSKYLALSVSLKMRNNKQMISIPTEIVWWVLFGISNIILFVLRSFVVFVRVTPSPCHATSLCDFCSDCASVLFCRNAVRPMWRNIILLLRLWI